MNFILISLLMSSVAFSLKIPNSDKKIPTRAHTTKLQLKNKFKTKALISGSDIFNGTKEVQKSIELMHKKLRSFTMDNYFDFQDFASQTEQLDDEIQNLIVSAKGPSTEVPAISKQVTFIVLMFEKMKFGAQVLHFYHRIKPKENHWIKIVIQINIYLLSLYDSFGNLEKRAKNLEQNLRAVWNDLQILDYSFDEILGTSEWAREFFSEQISQARETCLALVRKLVESRFDV